MKKKTKLSNAQLLMIAAALGFVFFVMRPKAAMKLSAAADSKTLMAKEQKARAVEPLTTVSDKASDRQAYKNTVFKARRQFTAKGAIGLKSLALVKIGGSFSIPFRLVPIKRWCVAGDIDTMKSAVDNPTDDNILVSLESMDGAVADSFRTSVASLYKGADHTFRITAPSSGKKSFALFICSDFAKGKSCRGKSVESHEAIDAERSRGKPKNLASTPERTFFFQHVVLSADELTSYGKNDYSEAFKNKVDDYMTQNSLASENELKKALKVSDITRSTPLEIVQNKIEVRLPYNDPRCVAH